MWFTERLRLNYTGICNSVNYLRGVALGVFKQIRPSSKMSNVDILEANLDILAEFSGRVLHRDGDLSGQSPMPGASTSRF